MGILDDFAGADEDLQGRTPPTQRLLDWLHSRADTRNPTSIHHALGHSASDAARGDHTHDGKDSQPLFKASDVPANLPGSANLGQVVAAVNAILTLLRQKGA